MDQNGVGVGNFQASHFQVPHIFSDTNPSNFIICKFTHFKQHFSLQNSKTTYYEPFLPISTEFQFLIKLFPIGLNTLLSDNILRIIRIKFVIRIICNTRIKQLFSLQNSKMTHYEPFLPISIEFHFLIKLFPIGLQHSGSIKPYI